MSHIPQKVYGWFPDVPDSRDLYPKHHEVAAILSRMPRGMSGVPTQVDLRCRMERETVLNARDQGALRSCSACAVLTLVEYLEALCSGNTMRGSARFLYKTARSLMQLKGNAGLNLRSAIKSLVKFGVPPESYFPYDVDNFDEEPSSFVYRLAIPAMHLRYFRLDQPNTRGCETLEIIKSFIAAGFPVAFGMAMPCSNLEGPEVPLLNRGRVCGGHAFLAMGYAKKFLLVQSSWGNSWGEQGFGWLPFQYVEAQMARDFWTVVSEKWIDAGELRSPDL